MFSWAFVKDSLERAIATFAQALLAAGVVLPDGYFEADNLKIAGAAAFAAVLKAIVASHFGDKDSASLVS